ncbi:MULTISPECIES: hypothetical protein [unclassified Streptomyces]|uniref:hypothetical protein n=1 Tax=unclassified Streptomyces TaxID=2593676 RepID=UPI0036E552C3
MPTKTLECPVSPSSFVVFLVGAKKQFAATSLRRASAASYAFREWRDVLRQLVDGLGDVG